MVPAPPPASLLSRALSTPLSYDEEVESESEGGMLLPPPRSNALKGIASAFLQPFARRRLPTVEPNAMTSTVAPVVPTTTTIPDAPPSPGSPGQRNA